MPTWHKNGAIVGCICVGWEEGNEGFCLVIEIIINQACSAKGRKANVHLYKYTSLELQGVFIFLNAEDSNKAENLFSYVDAASCRK